MAMSRAPRVGGRIHRRIEDGEDERRSPRHELAGQRRRDIFGRVCGIRPFHGPHEHVTGVEGDPRDLGDDAPDVGTCKLKRHVDRRPHAEIAR
jgi:hypothetical protein